MAGQPVRIAGVAAVFIFLILYGAVQKKILKGRASLSSQRRKAAYMLLGLFAAATGFFRMSMVLKPKPADILAEEESHLYIEGIIYKTGFNASSTLLYVKDAVLYTEEESYASYRLFVTIPGKELAEAYLPGQKVRVQGKLTAFPLPRNLGEFHSRHYYRALGLDYRLRAASAVVMDERACWPFKQLTAIKRQARSTLAAICTKEDFGILCAMLLGERAELTEEINALFQKNGISHLLSISGLHISLIGMGIYKLFRKYAGFLMSGLASALLLFLYVWMAGSPVSAVRAFVMFLFLLGAALLGRTYDMLSAASFIAFLLLFHSPFLIYHSGFLLSFGAVFAIGALAPLFYRFVETEQPLMQAFLSGLSVYFVTLPVLSWFFFGISPVSLLLNLAVIPCMGIVLLSGILGCVAGSFSVAVGMVMIGPAHWLLLFYRGLCSLCTRLPFSFLLTGRPSAVQVSIYFILLTVFIFLCILIRQWKEKKGTLRRLLFLLGFAAFGTWLLLPFPDRRLFVTFLDVSQGDGIYMKAPSGTVYLVDAGSSDIQELAKYRLLPFLKANAVQKVDFALVSHADLDHISGIRELLTSDEIEIGTLVMPQTVLKDEAYLSLIETARENGTGVLYLEKGDRLKDGELQIECLHPYALYPAKSRNDASMVLHVSYGAFDMLLCGDLESSGEKELLQQELNGYELLKTAHHGSATSSSQTFLEHLLPCTAIISCGRNNSYGHPSQEALDRLSRIGCEIYMTMEHGAVSLRTDGRHYQIECFSKSMH